MAQTKSFLPPQAITDAMNICKQQNIQYSLDWSFAGPCLYIHNKLAMIVYCVSNLETYIINKIGTRFIYKPENPVDAVWFIKKTYNL